MQNSESLSSPITPVRKSYSLSTKKKAINLFDSCGFKVRVAEALGINRCLMTNWLANRDQILSSSNSALRLSGRGRKPFYRTTFR